MMPLLSFKKSPAPDVNNYVVYYTSGVELKKIDDAFYPDKPLNVSFAEPASTVDDMITHTDKLFYDAANETFYVPMQMSVNDIEGKLYSFAVVAYDTHGNHVEQLSSFSVRLQKAS